MTQQAQRGRRARRLARALAARARRVRTPAGPVQGRDVLEPGSDWTWLLPERSPLTVVVLADRRVGPELVPFLARFRGHRRVVIAGTALPEWRLDSLGAEFRQATDAVGPNALLRQVGPVDVLLDLRTGTEADHTAAFRRLFFHVRRDGLFVVDRRRITPDPDGSGTEGLASALRRLSVGLGAEEPPARGRGRRRALAEAIGGLLLTADTIVVTKRTTHHLKVSDAGATRLLRQRSGGRLEVTPLAMLKKGTLLHPGTIVSHGARGPVPGLDTELPYPELYLRRYDGPLTVARGGLVFDEQSVLPDSFRWHLAEGLPHQGLRHADESFARVPPQARASKSLPGSYYYLDYTNTGHFGHLMTEALAKVWGWHLAKEADPDLKLLLRASAKLPDRPRLEPQVLGAYGVDPDDIVWIDDHVRVESLVGASPMWHNAPPFYAHPGMREVWERLRAGITDPDAPTYDRIFVSRWQTGNRLCHNATEVERAFAAHGFEVLRPERFDLATQAGMFSRARVVAGFAGSGMFNTMFCQDLEAMVVLSQDAYTARNEHLFGALLGVEQEHYFWSPALEGTEGSYERHQSSWKFDFASSGAELDEVLRSLSGR